MEGTDWDKATVDEIELVVAAWNSIGVRTALNIMSREIYWIRACGNEAQVTTWTADRGINPMVDPIYIFPFDERSWMAPAYGTWYKSEGKLGKEPPAYFKEMMALYDEYRVTVDPDKQTELAKQLIRANVESLLVIGTVGMIPNVVVVGEDFRNVPENFTTDWIYMAPGTLDPCHFFFDH